MIFPHSTALLDRNLPCSPLLYYLNPPNSRCFVVLLLSSVLCLHPDLFLSRTHSRFENEVTSCRDSRYYTMINVGCSAMADYRQLDNSRADKEYKGFALRASIIQ